MEAIEKKRLLARDICTKFIAPAVELDGWDDIAQLCKNDSVCLKTPKPAVFLAQEGKMPCQKVGRRWRFHKEMIEG